MEIDLEKIGGDKFNVIGNFPYNISSQIMFRILENRNNVSIVNGSLHLTGGHYDQGGLDNIDIEPNTTAAVIKTVIVDGAFLGSHQLQHVFTTGYAFASVGAASPNGTLTVSNSTGPNLDMRIDKATQATVTGNSSDNPAKVAFGSKVKTVIFGTGQKNLSRQ